MTTLLIVVTVLSLAMAVAMSLVVLKMLREERMRSDARVAALLDAAAADPRRLATTPASPKRAEVHPPAFAKAPAGRRDGGPASDRVLDLPLRPTPAATTELFVAPPRRASWGPRIAVAAGVLAVLLGVTFSVLSPGRTAADGAVAASSTAAPLELLTLRHAAETGSLIVSGLVQNPKRGAPLGRAVATAYALAADGSVLATGRAPIDVVALGPGEESPFVVTVPVSGSVARYRIGFRAEDGSVIAHVDRRPGPEAVAQK